MESCYIMMEIISKYLKKILLRIKNLQSSELKTPDFSY